MDLSVVIVNYNGERFLKECLGSVTASMRGIDYEILAVDNGSSDGSVKLLRGYPQVTLILNEKNEGFAKGNNAGIQKAAGRYVLLLNADAALSSDIKPLLDCMDRDPSVGLAGCAVYDVNGRLQSSWSAFPHFFSELYKLTVMSVKDILGRAAPRSHTPAGPVDTDWVSGCFMLVPMEVLKKTGGMDEKFFFYYEDVDLCYSIKRCLGKRVVYYPAMSIKHAGGGSTDLSDERSLCQYVRSCMIYFRKRKGDLYSAVFYASCMVCWSIALITLGAVHLLWRDERAVRKIAMLRYAIGNCGKGL